MYQITEQKQPYKSIFFLFSSQTMTFLWTLPTPEPIRQRVVRWGHCLLLCLCQSAGALFAYNCTFICTNWLLWSYPGVPWKRHSKQCPSAHFMAHRPWHCRPDPCASCNWTLQSHKSNTTIPFLTQAVNENWSSKHKPPVYPNCTTCFMNVYLRQQAFSKE